MNTTDKLLEFDDSIGSIKYPEYIDILTHYEKMQDINYNRREYIKKMQECFKTFRTGKDFYKWQKQIIDEVSNDIIIYPIGSGIFSLKNSYKTKDNVVLIYSCMAASVDTYFKLVTQCKGQLLNLNFFTYICLILKIKNKRGNEEEVYIYGKMNEKKIKEYMSYLYGSEIIELKIIYCVKDEKENWPPENMKTALQNTEFKNIPPNDLVYTSLMYTN